MAAAPPPEAMEAHLAERLDRITGGEGRLKDRFLEHARRDLQLIMGQDLPSSPPAVAPEDQEAPVAASTSSSRRPSSPTPVRSIQCVYQNVNGRIVAKELKGPITKVPDATSAATEGGVFFPSALDFVLAPQHIRAIPTQPEPFKQKAARDDDITAGRRFMTKRTGKIVFNIEQCMDFWFIKGRVKTYDPKAAASLPPSVELTVPEDEVPLLQFESRFESGNLLRAVQVGDCEYNLTLRTDLFTSRHTQWFYFRVSNMQKGRRYKFNIINLLKPDSLYNYGMQPVVYSEVAAAKGTGWIRAGDDISYYRNDLRVPETNKVRWFYTLTWTYVCEHAEDNVYFAHCYPYTFSDLQQDLRELMDDPERSGNCRLQILTHTLAGNTCPLLTVSNFGVSAAAMRTRRGVVVTARVHPGETNGSLMMKGFIDFITSDHPDAVILRDNFVFKIVPMLNPDGVIVGNYRCSLAGVDLNRSYKSEHPEAYPTVVALKNMMQKLASDRPIVVYCDLHGHSRKQNVFMYGCHNRDNPDRLFMERVFPKMMELNGRGYFSYKSCSFAVKRAKEATGRVSMWRSLGIVNSITMEATFCGSTLDHKNGIQFNQSDFEALGPIFCDALMDYCDPDQAKADLLLAQFRLSNRRGEVITDGDDSESAGSDSSESDGETAKAEARLQMSTTALTVAMNAAAEPLKQKKVKKKSTRSARKKQGSEEDGVDEGKSEDAEGVGSDRDRDVSRSPSSSRKSSDTTKRRSTSGSLYKSKYENMSSNGIPTFSGERMRDRERRRAERERQNSAERERSGARNASSSKGRSARHRDRRERSASAPPRKSQQLTVSSALKRGGSDASSMGGSRESITEVEEPTIGRQLQRMSSSSDDALRQTLLRESELVEGGHFTGASSLRARRRVEQRLSSRAPLYPEPPAGVRRQQVTDVEIPKAAVRGSLFSFPGSDATSAGRSASSRIQSSNSSSSVRSTAVRRMGGGAGAMGTSLAAGLQEASNPSVSVSEDAAASSETGGGGAPTSGNNGTFCVVCGCVSPRTMRRAVSQAPGSFRLISSKTLYYHLDDRVLQCPVCLGFRPS
eukprot:m.123174 g.123174  ORF g.123174 m.123174 type:complete len:1074 (-) comp9643_c0_seq2:139-3360(-)